jgi:Na+-transporting NADH:ubiquinone oxidoreductase subunit C
MKGFSNSYTFTFSTIMVVVVAVLLALAAGQLKPFQDKNIELEKKRNILTSLNIPADAKNAEVLYDKYIRETFVLNSKGERVSDVNAFDIDMKVEQSKPKEKRLLPVYVGVLEDSAKTYVLPLRGKGLWGPIWGYLSFKDDFNTVYGAMFDHQGETPGLGAEIREDWFQKEFSGKKIFDENNHFTSIRVIKGGAKKDNPHEVDAISGGTITSKGLEAMVDTCVSAYKPFLLNKTNK